MKLIIFSFRMKKNAKKQQEKIPKRERNPFSLLKKLKVEG